MAHVFLSYSSLDRDRAKSLFDQLQDADVPLWADFIVRSGNLRTQTAAALERADAVIVLVSAESLASSEVTREWSLALDRGLPVIPALLPGNEFSDLPDRLKDQRAYKLGDDWASAVRNIAVAAKGLDDAAGFPADRGSDKGIEHARDTADSAQTPAQRVARSVPTPGQQTLTFTTALTLTAAVVLGATEGALPKLLGVPLALVIAFLCVRAAVHRGSMRNALRDGLLVVGAVVAVALAGAVVVASLTADAGSERRASVLTPRTPPASDAESGLLDHVPAAFRASCRDISKEGAPDQPPEGTVAAIQCYPDVGAEEVRYYQWFSAAQMNETFRFWLDPVVGADFCKVDGGTLKPRAYTTPRGSGRVYCVDIGNDTVIVNWTVDEMRVSAEAHGDRAGVEALYDWWKGGGLWT